MRAALWWWFTPIKLASNAPKVYFRVSKRLNCFRSRTRRKKCVFLCLPYFFCRAEFRFSCRNDERNHLLALFRWLSLLLARTGYLYRYPIERDTRCHGTATYIIRLSMIVHTGRSSEEVLIVHIAPCPVCFLFRISCFFVQLTACLCDWWLLFNFQINKWCFSCCTSTLLTISLCRERFVPVVVVDARTWEKMCCWHFVTCSGAVAVDWLVGTYYGVVICHCFSLITCWCG